MKPYHPESIEKKWHDAWKHGDLFSVRDNTSSKKMYVLDMFPYPSGDGLHVGHVKIYTASDVVARYFRMTGHNVLHPTGWDAFGLPTENTAIKKKIHPSVVTTQNIQRFRAQMEQLGFSYDWNREINTSDPSYYRWTQWIFLLLYHMGLAYQATVPINWCPSCKTGLANEEVTNGTCERCGTVVELRPVRQWMLRITTYAERLLSGLPDLDWPKFIKELQTNWIGMSTGVNFRERVKDLDIEFEVYDSIPQTFLAQTFTVIAPEHPLVAKLVQGTEYEKPVTDFVERIRQKKQVGKFDITTDMEGIFTGRHVDNPFGTGDFPIWLASFVLADYGTGIVNCSAHDERDFAFAKKYDIPLRAVLFPKDRNQAKRVRALEEFYREAAGILEEPREFAGMTWEEAREPVIQYIVEKGLGTRAIHYKLRDWVFSRQRYWGEPIPIIHCPRCGVVPVPEKDLPVELPPVEKYEPTGTGESPLAAIDEWVNAPCPRCSTMAKRETNTMPQWAGSSWYWLRYVSPQANQELADKTALAYWNPVDLYIGGAEHAVLHLLYARFWQKALFDKGIVAHEEPFHKFRAVGLVLGEDGQKMSKSRGNVVNPDDAVLEYGADAVRVYTMFMGPFGESVKWSTAGIAGSKRFLIRVWRIVETRIRMEGAEKSSRGETNNQVVKLEFHRTIKRVTEGIEHFRFNTALASLMEFLNVLERQEKITKHMLETYVLLLSPFAPHISEELWENLGHTSSLFSYPWPEYDKALLARAQITVPVQVNGKVRGQITIDAGALQEEVEQLALKQPNVAKYVSDRPPKNAIYIQDRLINFVI